MGEHTGISWTDHTFNGWWGCTPQSPGCDHCYAEEQSQGWPNFYDGLPHVNSKGLTIIKPLLWGPDAERRTFGDSHWNEPRKWNAAAKREGVQHRVFCMSMADVLDPHPVCAAERPKLWPLIRETEWLIWQLLTKLPQNYAHMVPADILALPRVWPGVTMENQDWGDIRVSRISKLKCAGPKWVSYEPAIGPLSLHSLGWKPDWVIFGGESGPERRPCERIWADDMKAECGELGVKFFMKQMGAATPTEGKRLIPSELLIQEFPA